MVHGLVGEAVGWHGSAMGGPVLEFAPRAHLRRDRATLQAECDGTLESGRVMLHGLVGEASS